MTAMALRGAVLASWMVLQGAAQDRSVDELAIRKEIESIFQAFIDKDPEKLAATHGKNWRGYLTGSRTVIKGRDGYMRANTGPNNEMGPKGQGMIGYKIREYDTVWYDDVAIVNFVADVFHRNGDRETSTVLTLMDIYAKEDGRWMQVASQTSTHPEAQEKRLSELGVLTPPQRASLLQAREAVWRAWYGGDLEALKKLLPPELITLSPGENGFSNYDTILASSAHFAQGGGKLTRLQFPRTEIQAYGNTAIIYTSYELETTNGGQTKAERGKATEIFVRRGGQWLNTGWQLAPETGR